MALTENQVRDVIATALIRAWEDEQFKDELLAKPLETIERLTGERINFKLSTKINGFEESNSYSSEIELPPYVIVGDEELNEKALDFVTGGSSEYRAKENFTNFLRAYL